MDASSAVAKNFAGKVLLYRTLDDLEPRSFLRRNIRDALDSHDCDLVKEKSNATGGEQDEELENRRRTEWEPPSEVSMDEFIKTSRPVLRISSLHMRESGGNLSRQQHYDEQPSWLPRPDEFIRSCLVRVVVRDRRNTIVHSDLRQGRVVGHDNKNKKMTFDVQLESPFDINIEQLSAATPTFTGSGPWHRSLDDESSLEIGIQHQDSRSAAEFLAHIQEDPVNNYLTTPASESIVRAKWSKLPDLPQDRELLSLKRNEGHKSLTLSYGLEVVMGWNQKSSPLARHNRMVRRRREQTRQLPTPVSDDLEAGRTANLKVKYMFRQGAWEVRSFVTNHLKCIFCRHDYEQSSFERLQLHYVMNHEHFLFEVLDVEEDLKLVRINHRDDEKVTETAAFAWDAPRRAFNTKAYLNDDTSWIDQPWQEAPGPHPPRPKKKGKATVGRSGQASLIGQAKSQPLKLTPKRKYTEPEQVQNLVPHERKKHMVPYVPGVEFYRTTSKQRLEHGTYISDSDEDVDDTWMKQSQRRDLKKLNEDDVSLDFNELFNKHLDEEQPMSDSCSRDSIVRFARIYVNVLCAPKWKDKFQAKLEQLMSRRILRNEEVEYCMRLVEAAEKRQLSEKVTPTPPKPDHSAEGKVASGPQNTTYSGVPMPTAGEATATTDDKVGNPEKAPAKPRAPNTGPCVCGKRIQGMRGTIACENVKCPAFGYHMACVGLEGHRPMGWKCDECSSST